MDDVVHEIVSSRCTLDPSNHGVSAHKQPIQGAPQEQILTRTPNHIRYDAKISVSFYRYNIILGL